MRPSLYQFYKWLLTSFLKRMFANRDYVFNRKYMVDTEKKMILIVSKTTEHPAAPQKPNRHRVEDYWSYMVVKPHKDLEMPGIEFVLTYFDNPGVNIPGAVTTWVAYRAMPDFLERLREASKKYKLYCKQQGTSAYCQMAQQRFNKPSSTRRIIEPDSGLPYCDEEMINDNTIYEPQHDLKVSREDIDPETKKCKVKGEGREQVLISSSVVTPEEILTSPSPMTKAGDSYWKYLKPMNYCS